MKLFLGRETGRIRAFLDQEKWHMQNVLLRQPEPSELRALLCHYPGAKWQ